MADMWLFLKNLAFLLAVQGTVAVYVPVFLLSHDDFSLSDFRSLGALPLLAGACVVLWCDWDFWKNGRGTPSPIDAPRVLVKRGLYGHARNPMYIGVLLVITGEAILLASGSIVMYAFCVAIGFHLFVLLYEEPTLGHKFGPAYEEYLRQVPRWIPRFRDLGSDRQQN